MRRFLVVGCGGSGGATLTYLMDQLRSDLGAHGHPSLPAGWQFVHIDVPPNSDSRPDGLPTVEEQGGSYFGCAPQAANYAVLDRAVAGQFEEKARVDTIGTWAPREPAKVATPISVGAGQYRAVGRMISLSRAKQIRRALTEAWDRLGYQETDNEMRRLRVPGLGAYDAEARPIVLVVSSMAGGAGASMALGICRVLTTVGSVDPLLMGVFMVAPNIFDSLPEASRLGVRPNALAMLGEIVASQTGAAREHDTDTLAALGVGSGEGAVIPFARVFPVGRFSGVERTRFGDGSPNAVYRGLGRGLAGLIMSEAATTQFVSYDLGNTGSPVGDQDLLGWSTTWENLPWGSYGFASLSMGRDRYAEYSAQRIARSAVERLLHGHLQPQSSASSHEQVMSLLDSQWGNACSRAGLPIADADIVGWARGYAFAQETVEQEAADIVRRGVEAQLPVPHGMQAAQWLPALRHRLAELSPAVTRSAEESAVRLAFHWHQDLLRRPVEEATAEAVAELGLPYAVALLDRLEGHIRDVVAPGLDRLAAAPRPDVTAIPAHLEPTLARLKGVITSGSQIVEGLVTGCRENTAGRILGDGARLGAQLLRQFGADVLAPLRAALGEAQMLLEKAMATRATDLGLARLGTDHPTAWPSDGDQHVPDRFDEANNEILLTSSADFPLQYASDLRRSVASPERPDPLPTDARALVVSRVVDGLWPTTGGRRPPGGLVEQRAEWRSRAFAQNPGTREPIIPSTAAYDVHVRPVELLARARQYVARPGESFDLFCRLSITDFVRGVGGAESEIADRRSELVGKFRETLALARPLISVDPQALQAVHKTDIEYRYKFSGVPLGGLDVADDLQRVLTTHAMIDAATVDNFARSLDDTAGVTRIDVFGSYPNYSPLVFDAAVSPAAEQWAQTSDMGRDAFWKWRRSRPLAAALPMGDVERAVMVRGWLVGQITGRIALPPAPYEAPVRIWDAARAAWTAFPHPLLTPPRSFLAPYDWLPAVLESVLLAVARSHEAPVMSSLRPYQLLRGLWDESRFTAAAGLNLEHVAGRRLLGEWLQGTLRGGGVSALPQGGTTDPGADGVDGRAAAATTWLQGISDLAGTHYMGAGERHGAAGGGTFSVVDSRHRASKTPFFRDLAPDVFDAATELRAAVEAERTAAHEPAPRGPGAIVPPAPEDDVVVPQAGAF